MKEQYERTAMLLGEEAINKLNNANVLIFGLGGVGGYVTEALARSGVGSFTLVDNDIVFFTVETGISRSAPVRCIFIEILGYRKGNGSINSLSRQNRDTHYSNHKGCHSFKHYSGCDKAIIS